MYNVHYANVVFQPIVYFKGNERGVRRRRRAGELQKGREHRLRVRRRPRALGGPRLSHGQVLRYTHNGEFDFFLYEDCW